MKIHSLPLSWYDRPQYRPVLPTPDAESWFPLAREELKAAKARKASDGKGTTNENGAGGGQRIAESGHSANRKGTAEIGCTTNVGASAQCRAAE